MAFITAGDTTNAQRPAANALALGIWTTGALLALTLNARASTLLASMQMKPAT